MTWLTVIGTVLTLGLAAWRYFFSISAINKRRKAREFKEREKLGTFLDNNDGDSIGDSLHDLGFRVSDSDRD